MREPIWIKQAIKSIIYDKLHPRQQTLSQIIKIYISIRYMFIYIYKMCSTLKQLLETTLLLVIKTCAGSTTDWIWVNKKVCSVTSEPSQSSSRRVSSFRTHQRYWSSDWWISHHNFTIGELNIWLVSFHHKQCVWCSVALMSP